MKRFISLLFMSCLVLGGFAQEGFKVGLRFSPIISFANIVDENGNRVGDERSSKLGISYGLMVNYGFNQNYGLSSGIHIVNSGFRRSATANIAGSDTSVTATQNISLTTVEIPLTVKLRTTEIGDGFFANGVFGVSANVTANAKNEYEGLNPKFDTAGEGTLQREAQLVNPLGVSFIFGGGGEYSVGNVGLLTFGLVYHQGLVNLNRQGKYDAAARGANEKYRLNYLSLELGYFF